MFGEGSVMRVRLVTFIICFTGALGIAGCRGDPVASLDMPEQLILYSIDGRDFRPGQEPKSEEKFHGYTALGKIEVTDEIKRSEIIVALKEGMARSDGMTAKCFWPRHAIRAVEKGRTIDYVICFECLQLEVHEGQSKSLIPVRWEPQAVFNRHLKEAGIPLAPGSE
jgi:hypothetical protein